ncbi:MAG: UDP-N-acetylmuramoyl-L-alanyl-D-glutamate--2,6-diaminopimelate ligase [Burkholderiales bacterium RIFCSPLOWO2_02_FULL_57_36]|nr:MAG: UDP-N-acetylmuramoyl-L-alanyl-D-glutamate--2,6-diaminopimelate ligase [Burkholderiales bacterium RIFCSPLOWO2_02_FULL_57_36]
MLANTSHLSEILAWLHAAAPGARLSSDSRSVSEGEVFLAYPGDTADGRAYIAQAIGRGAKAVLYEDADSFSWHDEWKASHRAVTDLKNNAGRIANAWCGNPDARMFTVAVTGTNGKTSCSQWLGRAISRLGDPTAVVGTLGIGLFESGAPRTFETTGFTTPDAVVLQCALAESRDAGAKALAIEASSIGLEQGRLNGMHFDAVLFTNLTRDHLDYHGDMAAYEAAKTMLFDWSGLKHAIINLDDAMGLRLIRRMKQSASPASIIGYTLTGQDVEGVASLRATEVRTSHAGTLFQLESPFGSAQVKIQLVGEFNVSNILGVLGVLLAKGIAWKAAIDAIESLTAVPGRMQQLGGEENPLVVIDYAHTPDALEKTLDTLRHVARQRQGRLWCVFGCGGDRDPGKRAQMGAVAATADQIIVTSDNPRNEDASAIIAQIVEGLKSVQIQQTQLNVIEDRAAAILWAVRQSARPDVVLIAGKGHESYQEIKGKKRPFLDADHAALALAARATMKGTGL